MLKLLTSGSLFYKISTIFGATSPFTQRATQLGKTKLCANSESYDFQISSEIPTLNIIHTVCKEGNASCSFMILSSVYHKKKRPMEFQSYINFTLDSSIKNHKILSLFLYPIISLRHQYRYSRTYF
jgi:hypothetical protein